MLSGCHANTVHTPVAEHASNAAKGPRHGLHRVCDALRMTNVRQDELMQELRCVDVESLPAVSGRMTSYTESGRHELERIKYGSVRTSSARLQVLHKLH